MKKLFVVLALAILVLSSFVMFSAATSRVAVGLGPTAVGYVEVMNGSSTNVDFQVGFGTTAGVERPGRPRGRRRAAGRPRRERRRGAGATASRPPSWGDEIRAARRPGFAKNLRAGGTAAGSEGARRRPGAA